MPRRKYRALDICCGGGGWSRGLDRAGFEVIGVDIEHYPCYPYPLILRDFRRLTYADFTDFDYVHFSPPCQQYSRGSALARSRGKTYPDLFAAARRYAIASGLPYTIENVLGSPAKGIRLYGDMFGLDVLRERIIESNLPLSCDLPRRPQDRIITVAGSHPHAGENWRAAMGITDKMPNAIVKEAIPPAYAEYIGRQIITLLAAGWKNDNRQDYEKPGADEEQPDYEHQADYERRAGYSSIGSSS